MADLNLIADAAYKAGFADTQQLATMIAIAMAESSGNPNANNAGMNTNGSVDYGLWQINSVHRPDLDKVYDPYYNAQQAYNVWGQQGYGAWAAYNRGKHAQYMPDAMAAAQKYLANAGAQFQANSDGRRGGGKLEPKLTGREVGQRVLSSLARSVSNGAVSRRLEGDGEVDEVDANYRPDVLPDRTLDDIRGFLGRTEQFMEKPVTDEMIPADAEPTGALNEGRVPYLDEAEVRRWQQQGLQTYAARGAAIARALGFDGTIHGVGQRGNKSDHPDGNATDLMVGDDRELGDQLANFFVENAADLGVKYVIWYDQIWSAARADEGWRPYTHPSGNTSNATLAHRDHPHISYLSGG